MGVTYTTQRTDAANIMHKLAHKALECTCHSIDAGTMKHLYYSICIYSP